MTIPHPQLDRWTNYESAAISSARDTHRHIRNKLERGSSRLSDRDIEFDTLLQGSYANDTIIRSSSDVDILVRLQDPFHSNKDELSESEVDKFYENYTEVDYYTYSDFRSDVINELEDVYGRKNVEVGDKAIEVESPSLDLNADVVPVQEYRYYQRYSGYFNEEYIEGIIFWPQSSGGICNYPEQHMENATTKHQRTNERYKPTIRMFKNARNKMDEEGLFPKDTAPSYFIECLLWNVPNEIIDTADLQNRYADIVDYLSEDEFEDYRQQHNLLDLFGYGSTKWSKSDANKFVTNLINLWNDW